MLPDEQSLVGSETFYEPDDTVSDVPVAGAEACPVADSEELVSWDDAEGTIEREREQFSDPFVVSTSSTPDDPIEPAVPTTSDPLRADRLERLEEWAESVGPHDLEPEAAPLEESRFAEPNDPAG